MPKRIAILGSTGSIGTSAVDVIEHLGNDYQVTALSAHSNTQLLLEQVKKFRPAAVCCTNGATDAAVCNEIEKLGAKVYRGVDGLAQIVRRKDVDTVLAAIVGAAGLPAVLATVEEGKTLALANKESLVVAGSLLMPLAEKTGAKILPVDSEHSAIFQAAQSGRHDEIKKVILTASGGPFRTRRAEEIYNASLEDALAHPTWRMGNKITIDSATMFNKALELIEACWLFKLPPSKIQIVIHPESIIHSMVEFVDNSVIAQLSPPDMRTPIQYALTYPERAEGISRRMDWGKAFTMHFEPPDEKKFPAIKLAYHVAELGGTAGAVLNAANEAAVAAFASGKVRFGQIAELVARALEQHKVQEKPSLDDLLEADKLARSIVLQMIRSPDARVLDS